VLQRNVSQVRSGQVEVRISTSALYGGYFIVVVIVIVNSRFLQRPQSEVTGTILYTQALQKCKIDKQGSRYFTLHCTISIVFSFIGRTIAVRAQQNYI